MTHVHKPFSVWKLRRNNSDTPWIYFFANDDAKLIDNIVNIKKSVRTQERVLVEYSVMPRKDRQAIKNTIYDIRHILLRNSFCGLELVQIMKLRKHEPINGYTIAKAVNHILFHGGNCNVAKLQNGL